MTPNQRRSCTDSHSAVHGHVERDSVQPSDEEILQEARRAG